MEELYKLPHALGYAKSRYAENLVPLEQRKLLLVIVSVDAALLSELAVVLAEYQLLVVQTWAEALRLVSTARVDLVLMEVRYPDWRGLGLLAQIRELRPGLPTVVLAGNPDIAIAVSAMKLGAFECVTKPVRHDVLLQVLRSASDARACSGEPGFAPANQRARALLVGGHLPILTTWRLLLDRGGIDSTIARTSADALHCIEDDTVHLLVLDDSVGAADMRSICWQINQLSADPIVVSLGDPAHGAHFDHRVSAVISGHISRDAHVLAELLQRVDGLLAKRSVAHRSLPVLSRDVARLVAYVAAHHTDLTLARVGKAIGLSRVTINRRFREELGTTFGRYVTCFRTYLAIEMLSDPDNKLEQVAYQTGFCDAAHLSRILVRHTGRRASFYRRH